MLSKIIWLLILIFCILFIFSFIFRLLIAACIFIYDNIQKFLLTKSNNLNRGIIGKIIILTYKIYKPVLSFLYIVTFFKFETYEVYYFEPKFFSINLKKICTCLGIAIIINIILNSVDTIQYIYDINENAINKQTIQNIEMFFIENKWMLMTTLGVMFLVVDNIKDRFVNKIISEIQDDELKKVICLHNELFKNFKKLQRNLCYNINLFLVQPKEKGILRSLDQAISKQFPYYEYDINQHSFKKRRYPVRDTYIISPKYLDISEIVNEMQKCIKEFKESKHFYDLSCINKYVHGLEGFNVTFNIEKNDEKQLLCKSFFDYLYQHYPKNSIEIIEDNNIEDSRKVEELNEILNSKNFDIFDTALNTIEYVIDIEIYLSKLKKIFALKNRRTTIPVGNIVDKYNKK